MKRGISSGADPAARSSPKRQAILEAAKRLFLEEPFDRVSMDAVAAAAQVSKVTIYAHFADKEELFVAAMSQGCLDLFETAKLDAAGEGDLRATLARLGAGFVTTITSDEVTALHGVMITEGATRPQLPKLFYEAVVQRSTAVLADIFAAEAAKGRLACADPAATAVMFLAAVQGDFVYRQQLGRAPGTPAEIAALADQCADLFVRALAKPKA
ncbi:MAG: TetR/AcrR family transcriptional regulator [Hyphomonadaceae bacterium]|nr:TetR/AcrR family transcriptional regulator [Hyphomonadaceae bacterium]